jgi:hypothetical protein
MYRCMVVVCIVSIILAVLVIECSGRPGSPSSSGKGSKGSKGSKGIKGTNQTKTEQPTFDKKSGCFDVKPSLEQLVRTNGTRAVMYILSHRDYYQHAERLRWCRSHWTRIGHLPTSLFFESIMYRTVLRLDKKIWTPRDYVITATYKTMNRTLLSHKVPVQSFDEIERMLRIAHEGDYDVVPFIRDERTMMKSAITGHKSAFKAPWNLLLTALGYSWSEIRAHDDVHSFYRSVFIIRPRLLEKLMAFMDRAMTVAVTNSAVRTAMQRDARYVAGNPEIAMQVFNTTYYQFHPFVFERLPAFFLYTEQNRTKNIRICMGPETPCGYNFRL